MDLVIYIYERADSLFGNGISNEEIEASEDFLSCKLSEEFKEFLKEFGYVELEDHDLAGLGGSDYFNFLVLTTKAQIFYDLKDLYVVEELDDNEYICQNSDGLIYKLDHTGKHLIANSLLDYLIS